MNKRERERAIFAAFSKAAPLFAGEPLAKWWQPADENEFPDICAQSTSGRRIGVELGEWLNQQEISAAKAKEHLEHSILKAIGDQPPNKTEHIQFVWLHPKPKLHIKPVDANAFRDELFRCIYECDERWPNERFWQGPAGARLSNHDLSGYSRLQKYLNAIHLWPSAARGKWGEGIDWITFQCRGGPFSKDTMLDPLREIVSEKIGHYSPQSTGFDELSLVIHYSQAAIYNSPVQTPLHTYADAAADVADFVDGEFGPFQRIFLFIAADGELVIPIGTA